NFPRKYSYTSPSTSRARRAPTPENRAAWNRSISSPSRRWSTLSRLKIVGNVARRVGLDCSSWVIASSTSCPMDASTSSGPATLRRTEHPRRPALVSVLQQRGGLLLGVPLAGKLLGDLGAPGMERVGDVLEELQTEDHALVLGGVHRTAELVRRLPQRVLEL